MVTSADKTPKSTAVRQQAAGVVFFRKASEEGFFGAKENPAFFKPAIQTKLTVSTPDDPHEKEADAMAEKVMRMPDPGVVTPSAVDKKDEKLQRKEDEEVQPKLEVIQAPKIQRKAALLTPLLGASAVSRKEEENLDAKLFYSPGGKTVIQRKNIDLYPSDIFRQSGRGPPAGSMSFEQTLASSKGGGSALPGDTQQFMESRFGADFRGVRIHTGSAAEQLSRSVNAQAFAHGNDIYFNSGKFSPNSTEGRTLLAHELTHTIQQGASRTVSPRRAHPVKTISKKLIARKASLDVKPIENKLAAKTASPALKKPDAPIAADAASKTPRSHAPPVSKVQASPVAAVKTGNPPASKATVIEARANGRDTAKKEDKEEENTKASDNLLQKRLEIGVNSKADDPKANTFHIDRPDKADSDGRSSPGIVISPHEQSLERGPPFSRKRLAPDEIVIQRALYDNALGRLSDFLSDIPITVDLDEAKRWLLNGVKRFASYIPGYRALGVVLGRDPIGGEEIPRNGRNFIEAALDIIPGGALIKQKLDELGLIDQAAAWIDGQIATLAGVVEGVQSEFHAAWNALGLSSILDGPTAILRNFGNILERGINNIIDFARRAATELIEIVKKFLVTEIAGFVKQHTTAYELLKVIIGKDPITDEPVERNGTNILNALLELGGDAGREQKRQMQETHTFEKAAAWIDRGIAVFGDLYSAIRTGFTRIWDFVSIEALMHPIDTFNQIYEIFAGPVNRVLAFVADALSAILGFIKEALMTRLSAWAKTIRGYPLVTVLIGKDPFTNVTVPRNVENIIRGFMSLMEGGEEQFNQLQQSGAISRTVQRINAAVARLNMTPEFVVQLFIQLWNSFSFTDLADPVAAFRRIMDRFGEPIRRLVAFVVEIVKIVVEVVLQVMNFPSDLIANIIAKAMQAFEMIKTDPVGFLKNLLRAIKQGFVQFFGNIGRHLLAGLQAWLMGELKDSGVQAPQDFSLRGIISWVLQLLGISMEKIWEKLAQHPRIGPQKVAKIRSMIDKLEGIWTFIKDVQQRGIAAIWDKIQEKLSTLWDTLLDAIKSWIMEQIVDRVVTKLLSMLDPTGIMAVINSAIALYKAIQSFIKYLRQLLEIVNSFVEGVVQIASGNIAVAANFLERSMARGVPVMIGFLANQVGLGGLGKRISEMVGKVRALVDQALTWLVNKAVNMAMNLLDRIIGAVGGGPAGAAAGPGGGREIIKPVRFGGEGHRLKAVTGNNPQILMASGEFGDAETRLREIRSTYVNNHFAKPGQEDAQAELDNRLRAIWRRKNEIIAQANAQKSNPKGQEEIMDQGLAEIDASVEAVNTFLIEKFSEAAGTNVDVQQGELIGDIQANRNYLVGNRIREMNNQQLGFYAGPTIQAATTFFKYTEVNTKWKKLPAGRHLSGLVNALMEIDLTHPSFSGLSLGEAIRQRLYGGWNSAVESWKSARMNASAGSLVSTSFGSFPGMRYLKGGVTYFVSDMEGMEISPNATDVIGGRNRNLTLPGRATIDHDPPVADHWTTLGGNNANQLTRQTWYNAVSPASHKIISRELNSSLSARGGFYTPGVGNMFRGPGET